MCHASSTDTGGRKWTSCGNILLVLAPALTQRENRTRAAPTLHLLQLFSNYRSWCGQICPLLWCRSPWVTQGSSNVGQMCPLMMLVTLGHTGIAYNDEGHYCGLHKDRLPYKLAPPETVYPDSGAECCLPTRPRGCTSRPAGRRSVPREDGQGERKVEAGYWRLADIERDTGEVRVFWAVSQIYEWRLLVKIVWLGWTWRAQPRPGGRGWPPAGWSPRSGSAPGVWPWTWSAGWRCLEREWGGW